MIGFRDSHLRCRRPLVRVIGHVRENVDDELHQLLVLAALTFEVNIGFRVSFLKTAWLLAAVASTPNEVRADRRC